MPTVTLHIGDSGKLEGLSEKDRKAYAKFRQRLERLGDSSLTFTWREPRSGPFHRRFFAMVNALLEAQEQFQDVDHMLTWLKVGAGYADLVPGPKGKPVAMAKSIKWDKLDQAEFEPIANAIFGFTYSTYATRFLWPHLSDEDGYQMVDSVLGEFM
jgi:hypothetical protein